LSGGLARAQATAVVAPEDAIRTLQSMLPPAPARPLPPLEDDSAREARAPCTAQETGRTLQMPGSEPLG